MIDRLGDAGHQVGRFVRLGLARPLPMPEVHPLDEFGHQIMGRALATIVVKLNDPGVPQPGSGASLTLKTLEYAGLTQAPRVENFEGDPPMKIWIESEVNGAERARSQGALDPVGTNLG
jgi:hypothetical protein